MTITILESNWFLNTGTGSKAYNMKLSLKRAENVANILVNTYGIRKDRLIIEAKGSTEQPYKDNQWNRVVVLLVVNE